MKILAIDPSINALRLLLSNLEQYGYELQGALDTTLAADVVRLGYSPEIVMINASLCHTPMLASIQQIIQALNNPYLIIMAILDNDSEQCVTVPSNLNPRSF